MYNVVVHVYSHNIEHDINLPITACHSIFKYNAFLDLLDLELIFECTVYMVSYTLMSVHIHYWFSVFVCICIFYQMCMFMYMCSL